MDEHDERTSLVRSDNTLNRTGSPTHNNNNIGYNTGNDHHRLNNNNNNNPASPSHSPSGRQDFAQRDPWTLFARVQRSVAFFQTWAAKTLHENKDSSVVNWIQSTRVSRTFMMTINVILVLLGFLLMGAEMVEMVLREPILDYLLPESEIAFVVAGLTIVTCAFGFAVAYNLLVDDGTSNNDDSDETQRDGSDRVREDPGLRSQIPPHHINNMLGQNNDTPSALQQRSTRRPRLMFTKASTYLLIGNAFLLSVVVIAFMVSIMQRSTHLSQMEKELNSAWTDASRHSTKLIRDFELRHQCCGYNNIIDRPFPPLKKPKPEEPKPEEPCSTNPDYGFQVPCKAQLTKDFERWQSGIQHLLLVQMAILLPLFLLVAILSLIGFAQHRGQKRTRHDDAEAQADATAEMPAPDGSSGAQYGRPMLQGATTHNVGSPLLVTFDEEPVMRFDHNRATVTEPTLI